AYGYSAKTTNSTTGANKVQTLTTRTTKFFGTGLDFKDNTLIFVAYAGAFLITNTKGVVQNAGIHNIV
ncbi:MAG: hypothetical protein PHC48_10130, partial [Prevotella sp.]|nr:hypothetical protein [Prevotella sp.]